MIYFFRGPLANVASAQQVQRIRQHLVGISALLKDLNDTDEKILATLRRKH